MEKVMRQCHQQWLCDHHQSSIINFGILASVCNYSAFRILYAWGLWLGGGVEFSLITMAIFILGIKKVGEFSNNPYHKGE